MRIDKFMNSVNITKRRAVAQDMLKNGAVCLNGVVAKSSKDVKLNDVITINYLDSKEEYEVLKIPTTKTVSKSLKDEYIKRL